MGKQHSAPCTWFSLSKCVWVVLFLGSDVVLCSGVFVRQRHRGAAHRVCSLPCAYLVSPWIGLDFWMRVSCFILPAYGLQLTPEHIANVGVWVFVREQGAIAVAVSCRQPLRCRHFATLSEAVLVVIWKLQFQCLRPTARRDRRGLLPVVTGFRVHVACWSPLSQCTESAALLCVPAFLAASKHVLRDPCFPTLCCSGRASAPTVLPGQL